MTQNSSGYDLQLDGLVNRLSGIIFALMPLRLVAINNFPVTCELYIGDRNSMSFAKRKLVR